MIGERAIVLVALLLVVGVLVLALLIANLWAWRQAGVARRRRRADFALEAAAVLDEAARLCQATLPRLRDGQTAAVAEPSGFAALREAMRALAPAAPPDPRILASANRGFAAIVHAERLESAADPEVVETFIETANVIWRERETLLRLSRER
jgi:hypothetical protein